jgi:hypothetical protein
MVVSANTFFDGSVELPDPPKTGASISINRMNRDPHLLRSAFALRAGYAER